MPHFLLNKTVISAALALSLTACSMFDKSDNYQLSRSNDVELVVPAGSVASRDTLVIPNEDSIPDYTGEMNVEGLKGPISFMPLANVKVSWQDETMWIESSLDTKTAKGLIKSYLVALSGDLNSIASMTDDEIVSAPIGDKDQGALLKFYYSITRLYPDRPAYRFKLESTAIGSKIGLQSRLVSQDKNQEFEYGEWLSPDESEESYSDALQFLSTLSSESMELVDSKVESDLPKANQMWLKTDGQYLVKLSDNATELDVANLIEQSDLHLVSRSPLELAFVTAGEVTKVGDIRPITLPSSTEGEEDMLLFNLKYRNLDSVEWQKRAYPVVLVQSDEGVFVEVDVSAVEFPDVVSYRIMSALQN